MSKGRDFRGPKKRGFDDDAPSPYDTRPARPARSFGGGGFGAAGGGGFEGGSMSPPAPTGPVVDAVVKWFKGDKGFGFVELSNGAGDAFLHIGALQSAGFETVPPGAKLKVHVGNGAKGAQVTRVIEVDTAGAQDRAPQRSFDAPRAPRRAPDPSTAVSVAGKVKWFDDTKGFGFVSSNDGGKDVFVHRSALSRAGLDSLAEGQTVTLAVVDGQKGREAQSINVDD